MTTDQIERQTSAAERIAIALEAIAKLHGTIGAPTTDGPDVNSARLDSEKEKTVNSQASVKKKADGIRTA